MSLNPILQIGTTAPVSGGDTRYVAFNSDIELIYISERGVAANDATNIALSQKFPARATLISAQLKWSTALSVDGTDGTNGTADTVCLTKTAIASLTTNASTDTIIQGSTTKTKSQLTINLRPLNAAQWVNETTSEEAMFLMPFDPDGETEFDTATDGYLFNGTQEIDVSLICWRTREIPDT